MPAGQHSHSLWRMYRIIKRDIGTDKINTPKREFIQFICLLDGEIYREVEVKDTLERA